jgi:prepilin-type N-terminal cleavage/methylation domain-containing protein
MHRWFDRIFHRNDKNGFTIIELLVAMSVFVIIIAIVSSTFISTLRAQRTLLALMAANDSASLAMEQMMREIRTGRNFCIGVINILTHNCPVVGFSNDNLSFENANNQPVVYQLNNTTHSIERSENGGTSFAPITNDVVEIYNLRYLLVDQNLPNPQKWPKRLLITFRSQVSGIEQIKFETNWQTSVSVRTLQ